MLMLTMRRVTVFLVFLLSTVAVSYADTISNGFTITTDHPRLFWTPAKKAQAQTWATSNGYTGITSSGGRSLAYYDTLFTCYVLENSTACSNIVSENYGKHSPSDVDGDVIRRDGEWGILTYDWLYGQLTTTERQDIMDFWIREVEDETTDTGRGTVNFPGTNYWYANSRNMFNAGIAFMEHTSANGDAETLLSREYTENTFGLWPNQIDFVTADTLNEYDFQGRVYSGGGINHDTQEGSGYGRYGYQYRALMLPGAKQLGRDLWQEAKNAYYGDVIRLIYDTMPVQTTNRFNTWGIYDTFPLADDQFWEQEDLCGTSSYNGYDGKGGCGAAAQYYGDFMQAAATEFSDINIGKYARQWIATYNPAIGAVHRSVDNGGDTLVFSNLPLDYYSEGSDFFYLRNNWTSDATVINWQMALTNGGTYSHGHHDAGNFQVFRKGAWLIKETVAYTDIVAGYGGTGTVYARIGEGHNVPFVGGMGGSTSFPIANAADRGTVTRVESNDSYAFAATDLSDAYDTLSGYPERENPYEESVVREYYYLRGIDAMVIVDRIETLSPSTSIAFVSHCETSPSISGNTITCTVSGQEAKYTALSPYSFTIVNESSNGANASNWQYRIEAENNTSSSVKYSIYAIEFDDSGASTLSPSIVDSNPSNPISGTFTITLDASNSITINKGMTSSGGTITATGTTKNLENGKEVMTITDNGPVWSAVGAPTCSDGVMNGDETGVDCGGSCSVCGSAPVIPPLVHPAVNN